MTLNDKIRKIHSLSEEKIIKFMETKLKFTNVKRIIAIAYCPKDYRDSFYVADSDDVFYIKFIDSKNRKMFTKFLIDADGKMVSFYEKPDGEGIPLYAAYRHFLDGFKHNSDLPKTQKNKVSGLKAFRMLVVWGAANI